MLNGQCTHPVSDDAALDHIGAARRGQAKTPVTQNGLRALLTPHSSGIRDVEGCGGVEPATEGEDGVLRRIAFVAAGCLVFAGAGCQSLPGDPVSSADPPAFETGILTSNEANRLGRADLAAGNYGNAERHFRTAVEKDRNDVPSWIGLAAAYDNLGRFDLADRAYREASALQGETFEIINNRGYSYLLRGDRKRALIDFKRALAIDPGNQVVRNNLRLLQTGERPNRDVPI